MKIESIPLSKLVFDPANARKHSQKNLDAIKGSLKRFGQQKPIVVNKDNVVIAGNGTLDAARSLGWKEINVVRTELSGADLTAFGIADNRSGELAEWDLDNLGPLLRTLQEDDFDLGSIGFDDKDLAKLMTTKVEPGLTDDDAVPEQVETRCKPGDLWLLGEHRLLCGDSTNVQHVERLMNGEKADMVFTDPPYGISIVKTDTDGISAKVGFVSPTNAPSQVAKAKKYKAIEGDDEPFDPNLILGLGFKTIILWGANHYASRLPDKPQWLIWDKKLESGKLDHNNFSDCELAWTNSDSLSAKIYRHTWAGMLRKGDRNEELKDRVHPTQKPVGLCIEVISDYSKNGHSVLDLYLGSGSTIIACEKTNRKCYGMEIDPHYCDVIIKRWEQYTGKTASLTTG